MFEILISIFVALCYGISASIQKYSLGKIKTFSARKLARNKKWVFSLALGGFGALVYIYALRFVELSTIQPILALSIVFPVLSGILFFKEKHDSYEIFGIVLIIVGVVWISII